jgi:hypothetical protein
MSFSIRWALILIGSLLLWAPSAISFLTSEMTIDAVLLRYAGALALCWFGVSVIARIIDSYATQAEADARKEAAEAKRRRHDDVPPAEPEDPAAAE